MKKNVDPEFERITGVSIADVIDLYTKAVENDWQTVQKTTQEVFGRVATSRAAGAEAAELLRLSRAILQSENDDHMIRAGLKDF